MIPAVMPTYARADVAFEQGEGAYLFDTDGRRYLDFASGIAVTGLGHAHPYLVAALQGQAAKLWHTSNLFRVPGQEKLAQRLVDNCGPLAVRATKEIARRGQELPLVDAIRFGETMRKVAGATEDAAAFREAAAKGEKPTWQAR